MLYPNKSYPDKSSSGEGGKPKYYYNVHPPAGPATRRLGMTTVKPDATGEGRKNRSKYDVLETAEYDDDGTGEEMSSAAYASPGSPTPQQLQFRTL